MSDDKIIEFFRPDWLQRVPGHPEVKSDQNLIRNSLLEAILVTGGDAMQGGRVFSRVGVGRWTTHPQGGQVS